MIDLSPEQIKDALTDEEQRLLGNAEAMCDENTDNEYDSMVCDALVSLVKLCIENPQLRIKIKRLKGALKNVMEWIGNWDPNFADDPEWPKTEDEVKALLGSEG